MEELKIFDLETVVMDVPLPQDFKHEEVFSEGGGAVEGGVSNRRSSVQNQNAQKETYYACPIFGLTHAINELNAMEDDIIGSKREEINAYEKTKEVVKAKEVWFSPVRGGTMQGSLNHFKKAGKIEGYTLVRARGNSNGDKMSQALDNGFILYTGSGNIDWKNTCLSVGAICIPGQAYNHIFSITGYRFINGIRHFEVRQSVGTKYYDNGYAYLSENIIASLFSVYAVIDKDDTGDLYNYKAIKLGIYNGNDPERPFTRFECAKILSVASGKEISNIYNAERINDIPSDTEVVFMCERVFGIHESGLKTRRQLAIFSVKNKNN